MKKVFYLLLFSLVFVPSVSAQNIRTLNNDGVEEYEKKNFSEAELKFRKGKDIEPDNKTVNFNLGGAYYKQDKFEDALKTYNESIAQLKDKKDKSAAYYNLGNTLMKQEKYKESIEAYKNALKNNPFDAEAKYNLSYALKKLSEQQNQNKDDKKDDKKEDKKDDKKDQQNKDNQNNEDKKKDDKQENQNKQDQQQQQNGQQKQQEKPKISKEDAEKILGAMKNNEKEIQKKLRKKTGARVQVEKDW